jgi:hypothetical protein
MRATIVQYKPERGRALRQHVRAREKSAFDLTCAHVNGDGVSARRLRDADLLHSRHAGPPSYACGLDIFDEESARPFPRQDWLVTITRPCQENIT